MNDTIDALQDRMLKAIRDARKAKGHYDFCLRERIVHRRKVDESFHEWHRAKKVIDDCVIAIDALVGDG